ncbi:hypothetical protein SAY86_021302 [Trapa natans]|uniref:Uncharacterized protein n=1 Tax=Trapa natans TaxID=22666 RepID=A0AAN7MS66_TRANT|nr:hypothetical protein SAY86_021302 [Trapa natans]
MAKNLGVAALIAALCLVGAVYCQERLIVQGSIFCDTCRVDFATPLSYDLKDTKVKLECRNTTTNVVTLSMEGKTDKSGWYKIEVDNDHDDELCEVSLVESGDPKCGETLKGMVRTARIALTNRNGVAQETRFAGALSYATKESHADCAKVLLKMGVLPPDFFN